LVLDKVFDEALKTIIPVSAKNVIIKNMHLLKNLHMSVHGFLSIRCRAIFRGYLNEEIRP
jgi:hypothetical protein